MEKIVGVPYDDYNKLVADATDKANVIKLLNTEFPDAECQIKAVKTILEISEEQVQEPEEEAPDEIEP